MTTAMPIIWAVIAVVLLVIDAGDAAFYFALAASVFSGGVATIVTEIRKAGEK